MRDKVLPTTDCQQGLSPTGFSKALIDDGGEAVHVFLFEDVLSKVSAVELLKSCKHVWEVAAPQGLKLLETGRGCQACG